MKIELRCHRYPSESRSIWKRGETRRQPRIFHRFLSFPLFLSLAAETIPRVKLHRRGSLGDKALFQDFRALYTEPTSRIVC